MAREPHAWFRQQTGWWMTTINRQKIKLVKGKDKKAEANKKLRELLQLRDLNPSPESGELTVAAVIDLYLTHAKNKLGEQSLYNRKLYLQGFAEAHGFRRVNDRECLPFHLTSWIDAHPEWGSDWTKQHVIAVIHRPFNWAAKQRLIAANPQSATLYLALGNAYRLKGDYAKALATLQKGAGMAPKDPGPMVAEAEVLTNAGRQQEALEKYRAALRLAPNNATLLNNVAYLLADTGGSLEEALKDARRALELDAKQPRYSDTLGWIYYKQNLNDTALQVFRSLTATNPDNPTFHYHFAMVLLRKGDKATAKAELENVLAKKPSAEMRHDVEKALSQIG